MAHFVKTNDEKQLVLKREQLGCAHHVLTIIGFVVLLLAGYLLLQQFYTIIYYTDFEGSHFVMDFNSQWRENLLQKDNYSVLVFIAISCIGAGLTLAGLFIIPSHHKKLPDTIIFDHTIAAIRVKMKGDKQEAFISYSDLKGFYYRRIGDDKGSSTRTYHYFVFIRKKDGGEWWLVKYFSEADAKKMVQYLTENVDTNKAIATSMPEPTNSKISIIESNGTHMLHWQNKLSAIFFFLIILLTLLSAMVVSVYFTAPALSLVFLAIPVLLLVVLYKLIQQATRRFSIVIDKAGLALMEFSVFSGQRKKIKKIALETIERVVYTYHPEKKGFNTLSILTKEESDYMDQMADDAVQAMIDIFSFKREPLSLVFSFINPVEGLEIERWIEKKLKLVKNFKNDKVF